MHRANCLSLLGLTLLVLLSACGQSQPPAASAQPAANPDPDRLVRISRFDCATSADVEDVAEFPWSKGISLWSGGGPGGAAWNVSKLRCAVELQTTCARGAADIELRIGSALSEARQLKIEHAGIQHVTFDLAPERWEPHLDQESPLTQRFPYRTATFSASATASCEAPDAFGPSEGPRLEFADDRHFTAGFASGE
jgi:hypothetical protein